MNVPLKTLQKLKCSNCEDILSCGPVRLKHDGSNLCGRCSSLDKTAVPNMPYNELAEMCAFPCKYEAQGCYEKVIFDLMKEHEEDCEFRSYICPAMPPGSCGWVGTRNKILEHTQEAHPEKILPHPCEMECDLRTASLKSFLTTAFNVLFLIQVKVCLSTYTIYHSVRKVGEISDHYMYKYDLNVETEYGSLIRKGEVAPQGCLALQEDTAISVKIIALMEALKDYKNSKFFITILEYMLCFECKEMKTTNEIELCDKINKVFYCASCSSTLNTCNNSPMGCLWKGISKTHTTYFCTFSTWCDICKANIEEISMLDHILRKEHGIQNIKSVAYRNKFWSMQEDMRSVDYTISFNSSCYIFACNKEENSSFSFTVLGFYKDVYKIKSYLILKNSNTKYFANYKMKLMYSVRCGFFVWEICLQRDELDTFIFDKQFEVGVEVYCSE